MRPSRCPSKPWEPARSTNPVSNGSTLTHRRVSSQRVQWGFPRRVSSMPSTRVGSGSARNALAWATNARCAVGHDTPVDGGDLGHRAGRIPDRRADLGAQPPGSPRPGRDLLDGLGEGTVFAVVFPAPPAGLVPPQYDSILTVGNVARRGAHPTLHRRGEHPHTTGTPPPSHSRSPRAPHASHRPRARHARPVLLAAQTTMSYRRPPTSTTRSMRVKSQLPA